MEDIQDVIAESAREETDMSNMIGVSFSPLNTKNPTPLSKEREHSSDKSKKPKTNSTTTKRKKKGNIPHPFDHLILDQNWDDEEEVSMLTIPKALRDLAKKIKKGNNTQSGDNIKVQELENAIKPQRKTKTSTGESSLDDDINAILQNSKQKQEERQQKLLLVSTRKFRLGKDKNGSNESTKESSPETSLEDEKEIPAKEMAQTKAKKNAKSAITKPQEYLILDNDWDGEEVSLLTIPKPLRDLAKIIKNKKEGEDGNKTQTQDPKNTHEALVIPKVSIGQLVLTVEIKEEDKPSIRNDSSTPVPPRDLTPSKKFRKRSISEMTQKTTMEIADSQKKKNDKSTGTDLKQEIKERNHRTAEDLKNKSAIPSSKTKGNKRKKRANGANGLSNKTGVKSKAFQGRICSADKEKEISQKTQKCIHIISPMDEEVVLTLSELVGTPKNSASPETPTFIIRNDCVEQRNDTSRSNAIVLAKQPREDEEMGYIDEDIIIDTNRSAPGSAPRRQARASQVEMPQKQNYEQESENDDDISETSRRRSRVLCFIWICVCCLLFAIILIVVAVLLVKNDDNKMVESSPLPVNTSGEVESETDDDFFYTDELIVSPGLITTEMAEFDYDCDYNDQDGYPHVWDQCNCDGVISDVPEDVANLREELIIRLLPQVYGGNNYNAPISSCNPSNMALLWLASGKNRDTGNLRQRFVLALSFFAMGGPSWDYRDGWLTPLNECLWLVRYLSFCGIGLVQPSLIYSFYYTSQR